MRPHSTAPLLPVEWAVAGECLPGEAESGDLYVVTPIANGVLVAVMDGLGHGAEAAVAARTAATVLECHSSKPILQLVHLCHAELRRTRGAVLSLASFNAANSTLCWLGVGNVEGALFRADPAAKPPRETILLRGGVVGYELPPLRETVLPVAPGDTLVFATDGIRGNFSDQLTSGRDPQDIADEILVRYGKKTDDALVLVARYRGAPS